MNHYKYFTIDEELEDYKKRISAADAVRQKFPDAGKFIHVDHEYHVPYFGQFYSPSIVHEDDIKLEFWGKTWYSLSVSLYVLVTYEFGTLKVYSTIPNFSLFKDRFAIEIKEDPSVRWNNADQDMIKLGFKNSIIKNVYDEFLLKYTENSVTTIGKNVKLITEGLPEYITQYLPFV